MKIKTPVQFTINDDLVDADGQMIMQAGISRLLPAAQTAIIDAFENDARWRFLMDAFDNEQGPEAAACEAAAKDLGDLSDDVRSTETIQMLDLARAKFAALAAAK